MSTNVSVVLLSLSPTNHKRSHISAEEWGHGDLGGFLHYQLDMRSFDEFRNREVDEDGEVYDVEEAADDSQQELLNFSTLLVQEGSVKTPARARMGQWRLLLLGGAPKKISGLTKVIMFCTLKGIALLSHPKRPNVVIASGSQRGGVKKACNKVLLLLLRSAPENSQP
ncbi:eukaryotic peptide chain release factor subunit 1-3-like [Pyrus ussuriensis x Pyrus communis]|uniref:Eukaryotic peptide chain release factor subunit 1-3-like n=1 Tax=Pyrus ussuriensis x Pyrus communis TaxID=2448454 RepID=A0A5N5IFX4_9ROSA|nr:eukaryotic peptide chain release factor subunit 1-3-like [Pyrus ussuriensis x Pyrus communis]